MPSRVESGYRAREIIWPFSSMYFGEFSFEPSVWNSAFMVPVLMSSAWSQPSDDP
jgi:hypothetical protein